MTILGGRPPGKITRRQIQNLETVLESFTFRTVFLSIKIKHILYSYVFSICYNVLLYVVYGGNMKKFRLAVIILAITAFSLPALADGMMFEPVDVNYTPIDNQVQSAPSVSSPVEDALIQPASTEKFQNAILQLDSVQVELRNSYLAYKEKYQQIDAQYQQIKAERKATAKTVKAMEKKIKQIESTKSKIRKTMQ